MRDDTLLRPCTVCGFSDEVDADSGRCLLCSGRAGDAELLEREAAAAAIDGRDHTAYRLYQKAVDLYRGERMASAATRCHVRATRCWHDLTGGR
jgi:hypothetical protein